MNPELPPKALPNLGPTETFCRRLGQPLSVTEHKSCSYCHGRESDIRSHDHARFCDYDPDKDPLIFGFPDSHGRHQDG